ncbi:protection of telomeres protein 1 [Electrophorus electricus]|uniref:protection of telomeres protein 1 n=1 Tax=Electrophorus electricus TaxID=8005 RepID=UPI0015D0C8C0|nr:protection of telomeres protein 1 [Electrophorus electricus]
MPVHTVKNASDLDTRVLPSLQRILLPNLNLMSDAVHSSVKGKVVQKGPVVSCRQGDYLLKAVIQEEDLQQSSVSQQASINVFFFGTMAKDFSLSVSQGDIVLLAGFIISKSPTEQTDRLHPCHLEMSGPDACVYVCTSAVSPSRELSAVSSEPRYTYVPLNELKPRRIVNVYGVVIFFKQPFPTKGTDYCSTLKITDQSNAKVGCTIFSERLEDHPKIFTIGDIIRLHRVKAQVFNESMTLLTSLGWSAVTFDGAIGSPVEPRASSRTFHFGEADKRTVETLRQWAASQPLLTSEPTVPLSSVQPRMYFDLSCQLLAKACIDSRCMLLKVWDGTKCGYPLLDVAVATDTWEGQSTTSKDREDMTANILVYDNHVEVAKTLKPGTFLRLYNLHAVPQRDSEQPPDVPSRLSFHLHGGTSFGRGLRVLPSHSPDLQPLKRLLESHADRAVEKEVNDDTLLEVWYTPPESVGAAITEEFYTVQTCRHTLQQVSLAHVKRSTPPVVCHVRAQVRSYKPRKLYQCLKLFCPQCKSIEEVPDDGTIAQVFQEALRNSLPCSEHWAVTSSMDAPGAGRVITMHVASDMVLDNTHSQLLFLESLTLDEMCVISGMHKNIVPVQSENRRMKLLDFSAPFLFCGDKRYYGCKRCSRSTFVEPVVSGGEMWDEHDVAKALGVQLMQYTLLIQFELQDGTSTLDALLWEDAEQFFHVSSAETSANQDLQDKVQLIMDRLHPPGSITAKRPWLELCLSAYSVKDNGRNRVCYQITNTETRGNFFTAH